MKNLSVYFLAVSLLLIGRANSQVITSVDPDNGTQCQRLNIIVTGEDINFMQGSSFVWLEDGASGETIQPQNEVVLNSDQIEGWFYFNPQHQAQVYDVHVYSDNTGSHMMEDGFELFAVDSLPQLILNSPDSAQLGEDISISITGKHTHFDVIGVYNNTKLYSSEHGFINDYTTLFIDSTHITANFKLDNYDKPGVYDLIVSNNLDGEMILEDAFTIWETGDAAQIVSVVPDSAYQGEQLTVTVTGTNVNFQQGSSTHLQIHKTYLGTIYASNEQIINDTIIKGDFSFNFDNNPGLYDVTVTMMNKSDEVTLEDGFELLASAGSPSLTSVYPDIIALGSAVSLEIKAENSQFDTNGNDASVTLINDWEELYGKNVVVIDSVTLKADFVCSYANLTGYRELLVNTPLEGEMTLANALYIMDSLKTPAIVSVVPDTAMQKEILEISVSGSDIVFMPGTSTLKLVQGSLSLSPLNQEIVSNNVIKGEFEFAENLPTGKYDVLVEGDYAWPDAVLTDGFTLKLFDFIGETESHALLTVYPNPSNGLLNVKRNFKDNGLFLLQIYDINGRFVLEDRLEIDENEKQLDLRSFPKGVYFLKIQFGDNEQTEQFLIK